MLINTQDVFKNNEKTERTYLLYMFMLAISFCTALAVAAIKKISQKEKHPPQHKKIRHSSEAISPIQRHGHQSSTEELLRKYLSDGPLFHNNKKDNSQKVTPFLQKEEKKEKRPRSIGPKKHETSTAIIREKIEDRKFIREEEKRITLQEKALKKEERAIRKEERAQQKKNNAKLASQSLLKNTRSNTTPPKANENIMGNRLTG